MSHGGARKADNKACLRHLNGINVKQSSYKTELLLAAAEGEKEGSTVRKQLNCNKGE